MQKITNLLGKKYTVDPKKSIKTRWQFCEDIAKIIGRRTITVSTWLTGFKTKDVEDLLHKGTVGSFNKKNALYELIDEARCR